MKMAYALAIGLIAVPGLAYAERAKSAADATVFIRLVGSVHAEIEELGVTRTVDLDRVEIATGSGFVISPYGYVLTNNHVISDAEELLVPREGQRVRLGLKVARIDVCFPRAAALGAAGISSQCSEASVTASDPAVDLAVLFVNGTNLPYVALGDSDVVSPGLRVDALGYPFGRDLEVAKLANRSDVVPEISTTSGTVSAVRTGDAGEARLLQMTNGVNPGNSGGPLTDPDGFAVGVVRMRFTRGAGIGFAIPINDVKEFLDAHGIGDLMPARRLRLGPFQRMESKGVGLRMIEGAADSSPFQLHLETDARSDGLALRIDRVVSPWRAKQIEETLVGTQSFERVALSRQDTQGASRAADTPLLLGHATGTTTDGKSEIGLQYAVLDLGAEKLVARYVGPLEQIAFNAGVLRESLASLEAQRLLAPDSRRITELEWVARALPQGRMQLPLPFGWMLEPAGPSSCPALQQPGAMTTAFATQDFTVVLRAAVWPGGAVAPEAAAAACSSRRGSLGDYSYASTAQWLGVSYLIEGVFVRSGSDQTLQLEVLSPDQNRAYARALLAAWFKKINE